ncbi:MAG: 50S ribosomal protein L21 [Chloroflexota bacterium]
MPLQRRRRTPIYAVVETGGKQYRVAPGETIEAELLKASPGDKVELERVLLISDGKNVAVGTPTVPGAKVVATVSGESKGKKVIVFKYKAKVRYRKKTGHRQHSTRLVIQEIVTPQPEGTDEVKPHGSQKRRRQHKAGA